jgi:hypothetical protein
LPRSWLFPARVRCGDVFRGERHILRAVSHWIRVSAHRFGPDIVPDRLLLSKWNSGVSPVPSRISLSATGANTDSVPDRDLQVSLFIVFAVIFACAIAERCDLVQ